MDAAHRVEPDPPAESSAEREERPVLIQLEGEQVGLAGAENLLDLGRGPFPRRIHTTFGGGPSTKLR